MLTQYQKQNARYLWNDVMGIAANYSEDHRADIETEMSFTELGDDFDLAFLIGPRLDPEKALNLFLGVEEQVFEIDLDNLYKEDPQKVTLNFFHIFVPKSPENTKLHLSPISSTFS